MHVALKKGVGAMLGGARPRIAAVLLCAAPAFAQSAPAQAASPSLAEEAFARLMAAAAGEAAPAFDWRGWRAGLLALEGSAEFRCSHTGDEFDAALFARARAVIAVECAASDGQRSFRAEFVSCPFVQLAHASVTAGSVSSALSWGPLRPASGGAAARCSAEMGQWASQGR